MLDYELFKKKSKIFISLRNLSVNMIYYLYFTF